MVEYTLNLERFFNKLIGRGRPEVKPCKWNSDLEMFVS